MDLNSEKEWMRAVYHSEAERNACTYCKGVFPINFCSNTIFGVIANLLDPDTYPLKISDYECPGDLKPPQVFSKDFW
jgi:hypothetical protein